MKNANGRLTRWYFNGRATMLTIFVPATMILNEFKFYLKGQGFYKEKEKKKLNFRIQFSLWREYREHLRINLKMVFYFFWCNRFWSTYIRGLIGLVCRSRRGRTMGQGASATGVSPSLRPSRRLNHSSSQWRNTSKFF